MNNLKYLELKNGKMLCINWKLCCTQRISVAQLHNCFAHTECPLHGHIIALHRENIGCTDLQLLCTGIKSSCTEKMSVAHAKCLLHSSILLSFMLLFFELPSALADGKDKVTK